MSRWNIADVMTVGAVSVQPDTSFKEIVDQFEAHGINAVPVVDDFERVLGVVSSADLIPKIEFAGDDERFRLFQSRRSRHARDKAGATTAGQMMTAPAVTVMGGTSLVEATKIMEASGLKRLPVVDDLGRLTGMVTRRDLLKIFLRGDGDIRREILDEVLPDLPGVEPTQVRVEVDDGVVTLMGRLERRSLVPAAVRHIQRVNGVVDVISHLTYVRDDTDEQPVAFGPLVMF